VDRGERRRITERFIDASTNGDLEGLIDLLSSEVTLVSDGGGKARSPLRALTGVENVTRFLTSITTPEGIARFMASIGVAEFEGLSYGVTSVNGAPAMVVASGERVIAVISLLIVDGKIDTIYLMANPEKITHLHGPV
jgi:RNA polymerase sigma-70 factor (ECF subfamily)